MKFCSSIFLFILFLITGCSDDKNKLYVIFDRVDGLKEGNSVMINGLDAGTVTSLALFKTKVIASLKLKSKLTIPEQSEVYIEETLSGYPVVSIKLSDNKANLRNGDTLNGLYKKTGLLDALLTDSVVKQKVEKTLDKIIEVADSLKKGLRDSAKIKKTQ